MFIIVFPDVPESQVLGYIRAHGGQVFVQEGQPVPQIGARRRLIRLNPSATATKTIERLIRGEDIELHVKYAEHAYPLLIIVRSGEEIKVAQSNGTQPRFAIKTYSHEEYIEHLESVLQNTSAGHRLKLSHTFDGTGAQTIEGIENLCRELDITPSSLEDLR